jgi:uncharacterized protein (DUF952 family)
VPDDEYLYHVAVEAEWEARSSNHYRPAGFGNEGFVHLSAADQLAETLHRYYRGRDDLVLLTIDPGRIEAALVWEDLYRSGAEFPHVYGPIDLSAVVVATPLACDGDGGFDVSFLSCS